MREEIEEGHLDLQQLIFFSTQFMNFKTFNQNDIIYYEGDKAETFYILIKGNVNLFKLNFETRNMNAFDYYKYLKTYYETKKDNFILNKTIEANKNIFPVYQFSDIENFDEIIFKVKLMELIYKNSKKSTILSHIRLHNKDPKDFDFDQLENGELTMDEYFATINNKLTESESNYFTSITNDIKKVKIMENTLIKTLIEKEYFGLFRLEDGGDIRRNTAIVQSDNTLLLIVNKKLYSGCISSDQIQVKENEVDKIYNGTIFSSIRRHNFEKYYFYNLEKVEYSKGEEIFSEGEKLKFIYILKKGMVEVNLFNKNIIDIKKLIQKFKDFDKSFLKPEFDDTIKLKNSLISMKNYVNQKNNYSLFVINTKESFGIWEYCFNDRYTCYSVKVKSDKAIFYKMNIELFLDEIHEKIQDSELLKNQIKIDAYQQIKNYIERLIFLKNSVLMKTDIEFTKMKKEEENALTQKFNIFDVKNIMKPINHSSNINNHLKNVLLGTHHHSVKSMDINNSLKPLNNNNIRKFIYHKPAKSYASLKTIENEEKKNDRYSNFSPEIYIDKYNKNNQRNCFSLEKIKTENYTTSLLNRKPNNKLISKKIIFPKIYSPNRIQSPSYVKLRNEILREKSLRKIKGKKENENKESILTESFNLNNEKNVNYLAIREFYNKFNSSMAKNILNKSTK
jgi:CRP-like cAMP-binding protein